MPPKILFDARLVLNYPTGIGQYITSLLPELLDQAPDWQFHVLRGSSPWAGYHFAALEAPDLTQHISNVRHMSLRQHLYLPRFAGTLGARLIHYPHFDAPVHRQTIPVVATLYDAKYLVRPDFFGEMSVVKQSYMRFCFRQTLRKAAGVAVISQNSADDLERLFGTPPSHMSIIPLAPDPRFAPASLLDQLRVRDHFALRRPFILSVGELRAHKNHTGLIKAYAKSKSCATHDLVIVGRSHGQYSTPQELVQSMGLSDRIHILHEVDDTELPAFYTAADLFALLSYHEGFGLPLLEAMACGVPVIAADRTVIPEVVGNAGILVDPDRIDHIADAIDTVLTQPDTCRRLVALGLKRQANFTWHRTAEQTLCLYKRVLGAL